MSDILLLNPPLVNYDVKQRVRLFDPSGSHLESLPPLGICYIAAILENAEYDVRIVDMDNEKIGSTGLIPFLKSCNPKIVGISTTTATYHLVERIAEAIKEYNEDIVVALGGIHPTLLPGESLQSKSVDVIVRGEGEFAMLELSECVLEKKKKLNEISGISYREDNLIRHNKERPLIEDLDGVPFPARHLLKNERYFVALAKSNPTASIIGSRGCPYRCIFCSQMFRRIRYRSPRNIVDEIEHIVKNLGIREIAFYDSTFNVNRRWVSEVCDELIRRKVKIDWRCRCRIIPIDREILSKMKKAGCYMISFGVEASSNKFLNFLKKDITVDQVRKAFRLAKSLKFETHAYFLTGIPGETKEDIARTIKFSKELKPDFASFFIPVPFPGTELEALAIRNRWLKRPINTFDEKGFFHTYGWYETHLEFPSISCEDVEGLRKKAFRLFYLDPHTVSQFARKMLTDPKRILTSIRFILQYGI